ncbi:MAG TPA: 50S ribosome-binding GTPase [Planctomycetota bacterium]|nr:50S ribosome-binding GTPase [Planctomycetota bacterium]
MTATGIDHATLVTLHGRVQAALSQAVPGLKPPLELAEALLVRDLIPRANGGPLIVGLVGPNNAGKSAVFNGLCGKVLSPSRATGGATRRLVGAAQDPSTLTMRGDVRLVEVPPGSAGIEAALQAGSNQEWLVARAEGLPAGVLLVDAPDFDSIRDGHRGASESLLLVTDLALVVVTRHCYQNLEAVQFLKRWLGSGRPFALIYNEASSPDVARSHCAVLEASLGVSARARFYALADVAIAEGRIPLEPRRLEGAGETLHSWLMEESASPALAELARQASLRQLRSTLQAWYGSWQARDQLRAKLQDLAQREALSTAEAVAQAAVPMGPILEAFRRVLDKRPGLVRSSYRKGLRKASEGVTYVYSKLLGKLPPSTRDLPETLRQAELEALQPLWPPFVERLLARMMAAGASTDPDWTQSIARDLHPNRRAAAEQWMETHLQSDPEVWREFTDYCEQLVEEELDQRGGEWALQAMMDLAHILPAAVAGVIVVKSGGLLTDMAVGSMGALSSMAAERLSKFLGTQVAAQARARWVRLRREAWREWLLAAALPSSWPTLSADSDPHSEAIAALIQTLPESP